MRTHRTFARSLVLPVAAVLMVIWGTLIAQDAPPAKPLGKNLLLPERWADKFKTGDWTRDGELIMCDSRNNEKGRNCYQNYVTFNQETPLPVVVTAWSKCENVARGYSLMLDFVCKGEPNASRGQSVPFPIGTHDWVRRRMVLITGAPLTQANPHLWFEKQPSGKVWYKDIDVHQVDSKETLADLDGITEESLRSYDRNTTKDVVYVGLVGGEAEIIADVMAKSFAIPKEQVLALFKVPPSKNLYYSESDVVAACWAANQKKGDLEALYNKKRAMSFNDFVKNELKLDDAATAALKDKTKTVLAELQTARIKTILSIIEKVREKYR